MPLLGLGTWESKPGEVKAAIKSAILDANYTHIDGAKAYHNEPEVGEAYAEIFSGKTDRKINREDIFITSKLWNTDHDPEVVEAMCRKTLSDLQLDYLDMYLIHWGVAFDHSGKDKDGVPVWAPVSVQQTWQAMEKLVEKGLVKSIGVANFSAPMLVDLMTYAKILPETNQIELHPYNTQTQLVEFCQAKTISVTAYSPLGRIGAVNIPGKKLTEESVILGLAQKYSKTPSQILLNWAISRNTIVIPKSVNAGRIAENAQVFDFQLAADEVEQVSMLNQNFRFVNPDSLGVPYFA